MRLRLNSGAALSLSQSHPLALSYLSFHFGRANHDSFSTGFPESLSFGASEPQRGHGVAVGLGCANLEVSID